MTIFDFGNDEQQELIEREITKLIEPTPQVWKFVAEMRRLAVRRT